LLLCSAVTSLVLRSGSAAAARGARAPLSPLDICARAVLQELREAALLASALASLIIARVGADKRKPAHRALFCRSIQSQRGFAFFSNGYQARQRHDGWQLITWLLARRSQISRALYQKARIPSRALSPLRNVRQNIRRPAG
jgi:hypothetical protein